MPQRVLVTAGAAGIGLAIAKAFADSGARVHIADVNREALAKAAKQYPAISCTVCDVSNPEDLEALFDDVQKQLGGIDVLVNNAGISGATAPVADYPIDTWNAVVNVNLTGTFMVTQRAIPLLKESSAGSIIVMSSLAGRLVPVLSTRSGTLERIPHWGTSLLSARHLHEAPGMSLSAEAFAPNGPVRPGFAGPTHYSSDIFLRPMRSA